MVHVACNPVMSIYGPYSHIDRLMQERCNPIANTLEFHLSCINLSMWYGTGIIILVIVTVMTYPVMIFLRIPGTTWKPACILWWCRSAHWNGKHAAHKSLIQEIAFINLLLTSHQQGFWGQGGVTQGSLEFPGCAGPCFTKNHFHGDSHNTDKVDLSAYDLSNRKSWYHTAAFLYWDSPPGPGAW